MKFLSVIAILLGIFFRLYHLDYKIYWRDEVYTGLRVAGYETTETANNVLEQLNANPTPAGDLTKLLKVNPQKSIADILKSSLTTPHFPLYYILLRAWAWMFADSLWSLRLFSAVCSVLLLLVSYALAKELLQDKASALIATSLLALSPFQVLYAQEMRAYALLLLSFALSTLYLSKALRQPSFKAWACYVFALLPSALTHFLFVEFLFIHIASVVLSVWKSEANERKTICSSFAFNIGVLLLIASPWLYAILSKPILETHPMTLAHESQSSLAQFVTTLVRYISEVEPHFASTYPIVGMISFWFVLALLCFAFFSFVSFKGERKWFVISIVSIPIAMILLPDLLLGGSRGSISRYMAPLSLGISLILGKMLSEYRENSSQRAALVLILVTLLAMEGGSCWLNSQQKVWDKESPGIKDFPQIATIAREASPRIIFTDLDAISVISLSSLLPSDQYIMNSLPIIETRWPDVIQKYNPPFLAVINEEETLKHFATETTAQLFTLDIQKLTALTSIQLRERKGL